MRCEADAVTTVHKAATRCWKVGMLLSNTSAVVTRDENFRAGSVKLHVIWPTTGLVFLSTRLSVKA